MENKILSLAILFISVYVFIYLLKLLKSIKKQVLEVKALLKMIEDMTNNRDNFEDDGAYAE